MKGQLKQLHTIWLMARRSGIRRTWWRVRRMAQQKVIDPALASRLFPLPRIAHNAADFTLPPEATKILQTLVATRAAAHAEELHANAAHLLNLDPLSLELPVEWQAQRANDPLWEFRLHGWDWAWSMIVSDKSVDRFWPLVDDWIIQIPFGRGIPFQPHPTSRRLVVWMAAWHLLGGTHDHLSQIARQANFLAAHLEHDLDNNHLIANAKALAWVGLLWPESTAGARWRKIGLTTLWKAIRSQVRPDGGHFENSTSYQLEVLMDGLEILALCQAFYTPIPADICSILNRMTQLVATLMRPDQTLPLLNDSILNEHVPAQTAIGLAKLILDLDLSDRTHVDEKQFAFQDTGWAVWHSRSDGHYLLFNAGDIGPDHCPGHGHASALSVEWWVNHMPVWVDPGTFQYPAGELRSKLRSTAAHSTVVVDQLDQSEFTGPFRVSAIAHARLTGARCEDGRTVLDGQHDGYQRLADPVTHSRRVEIVSEADSHEIHVIDQLDGKNHHQVELIWQFSELARIVELDGKRVVVELSEKSSMTQIEMVLSNDHDLTWERRAGWVSQGWYQKTAADQLFCIFEGPLPVKLQTICRVI